MGAEDWEAKNKDRGWGTETLINNKTFEHANLIFTELWALANQIMLNISISSKTNFGLTGVYILSSISRTLHNLCMGFISLYRGVSELKNDTSILRKNGLYANKRCCDLTALFLKTKIYFCHYSFANK